VDVKVVDVLDATEAAPLTTGHSPWPASFAWGSLLITSQPASYRKIKRYTHESLGYGEITLPAHEFQTTGYWLWIPKELEKELAREGVLVGPNDYGPNWQQQRNAARARDDFRCRQCGASESGREHDVHHILPFRSFGYVSGLNENYQQANVLDNLLTLCRACHARTEAGRGTQTALGGLAYALGNLAPLFLMCDPRDLGVLSENRSKETGAPTITLYDHAPEGMGLAEQLYLSHAELLRGALELVRDCSCQSGCPACVGPVGVDAVDVKDLTRRLAERLVNG
jgi:DEAD/DEAH box helicase domain-containing protein